MWIGSSPFCSLICVFIVFILTKQEEEKEKQIMECVKIEN